MKTSDLLVKCLENEGIEYIFGVPGEENADFMMSLENSSIRFVLTRHEQGAAFMAEVYGRLTGNPAGCLGTLGPGATNLLTGVADANMDRAPLLCLTGQGSTRRAHKESHQIMDVVGMFAPVTKWSVQITEPDSVPEIVRKAVRTARREKPGAVLIELPENIAKEAADEAPIPVRRFRRAVPADKIVDQAWDLLKAAKSPVIIAGNGAIRRRASNMLREFCEQTGVGVMCTFMGKGAVDMDADYSLYTIGLGQRDHIVDVLEQADLVITLGYDMVEYPPAKWNLGGDQSKVIHIDFEPAEIDRDYDPDVEIVGDLAHSMWMINQRMQRDGVPKYDLDLQRNVRARMQAEFEEHANDDTEGLIRPQKAIWDVRQAMGPHDVVLSGVGAHKMWTARYYQCHEPNTCLIPNGFCSMGMPLPGVIAAHLVNPERKVLGIAGDGDFMMNVQEMETAARLNADVNMLVWVDGGYGLIAWKQSDEFKRHTDLAFGNPDWLGLAEAYGWHGQFVENARDLKGALDSALAHKGPSLIAIPIDYRENQLLTERLGKIQVNN
ncbi:acetolactate synthase large subunit [bacterium]|nr:acetolactate synthase large subunit [bacterium]